MACGNPNISALYAVSNASNLMPGQQYAVTGQRMR
jgi:hypothetical protein